MIEPLMMVSVLSSSVLSPPVIQKFVSRKYYVVIPATIVISIAAEMLIFDIVYPNYHYGPLWELSIVMYVFISAIVSSLAFSMMEKKLR